MHGLLAGPEAVREAQDCVLGCSPPQSGPYDCCERFIFHQAIFGSFSACAPTSPARPPRRNGTRTNFRVSARCRVSSLPFSYHLHTPSLDIVLRLIPKQLLGGRRRSQECTGGPAPAEALCPPTSPAFPHSSTYAFPFHPDNDEHRRYASPYVSLGAVLKATIANCNRQLEVPSSCRLMHGSCGQHASGNWCWVLHPPPY